VTRTLIGCSPIRQNGKDGSAPRKKLARTLMFTTGRWTYRNHAQTVN